MKKINWNWVIGILIAAVFTFIFIKGEGWNGFKAPTLSDKDIIELKK